MTTLYAASSPDLSGTSAAGWVRIIALFGVGSVIALFLTYWLATSVSADQKTIRDEQRAHVADEAAHATALQGTLERMAKQLEINCKVSVPKNVQAVCEVR